MNNLIPDIYQSSIYTINYDKLKEHGIKCLLFDLDNTISLNKVDTPSKELIRLFTRLEDSGFKVIIMSNSNKKRLSKFKDVLNVDTAYSSKKPLSFKYKKILKMYKFHMSEVAAIGDQLFTDILGANRVGITSILVEKLGEDTFFGTKINRCMEKMVFKNLKKRGIYEKERYYD